MKWILALWSRVSTLPWVQAMLKYAGLAILVLMILFQVRQAGKRAAQIDALERRIKANEQGREIEREVNAMSDGAALDELHRDWKRR